MQGIGLFDNFNNTNWQSVQISPGYVLGMRVVATAGKQCVALRWYAVTTSAGDVPSRISLWDTVNVTEVAYLTSIPTPSVTGWQEEVLAYGYAMVEGREYRVSCTFANAQHTARYTMGSLPTPPTGIAFSSGNYRCYVSGTGYPSAVDAQFLQGVDVSLVDYSQPPANASAQVGDLENRFVAWLASTSDNTRQTALPWLTKAAVDAVKTELDAVQTVINGLQNVVDTNSSLVALPLKALLARYASDITTIEGYLPTIEGRTGPPGSGGGSGTVSDDILTALQPVIDSVQPPAPATWVSLGTTPFDTSLALATPADLYQVTFTDLGSGRVNLSADGVDVAYRLAWWTEWDGAFAQERRFIDFPQANLYSAGRRMAGLLLHSPMGASGTVEAWTLG